MIGIICALESEFQAVLGVLSQKHRIQEEPWLIYEGMISDSEVMVIQSGIGKVNAASATMELHYKAKPDWIISIGFSGVINRDWKLGDVVLCDKVYSHDSVGFENGKKDWEDPYLEGSRLYSRICNMPKTELTKNVKLWLGTAASGDRVITNRESAGKIQENFLADCVDMESASICQVCKRIKVSHSVIRVLSDHCDKRAYLDFLKKEKELHELIGQLIVLAVKGKEEETQ